jgi:hypothetical protein
MPNQYTIHAPKLRRLPGLAVTEEERQLIYELAMKWRISLAQVIRLGLVAAGVLDPEKGLPPNFPAELLREALKGQLRAPGQGGKKS